MNEGKMIRQTCRTCAAKDTCKIVYPRDVTCNFWSYDDVDRGVTKKDTNPKDAIGSKKVPMHHISCHVLMEMGLGMLEGACKYGSHNYRKAGVRSSVYYDAAQRHLMAWWEGEDIDPESGLPHISKVLSCLSVLRDSQIMGNDNDDRPIRQADGIQMEVYSERAAKIIAKYPTPAEPFTHISKMEGKYNDNEE